MVTCGMVRRFRRERLAQLLGPEKGAYLYRMCRGDQDEKVLNRSELKSLSSAKTFFRGVSE